MTNDNVRDLIEALGTLALAPYPFPDGCAVDPRFAMALGLIAGIAHEALSSARDDRRPTFVIDTNGRTL